MVLNELATTGIQPWKGSKLSIPRLHERNPQSGLTGETHAGKAGAQGRSRKAPLYSRDAKPGIPRFRPLVRSGWSLSSWEKSKLNPITVINFKPGSPVRVRDFPFPLFLPGLSIHNTGRFWERNRNEHPLTEQRMNRPSQPRSLQKPQETRSPFSPFLSLGLACHISVPRG